MNKIITIAVTFLLFSIYGCGKKDNPIESLKYNQLNEIMNIGTIGIKREFFEKKYGPAKRSLGSYLLYEIGLCNILVEYDKLNEITSVELTDISKSCTFDGENINLKSKAHEINYDELIAVAMDWNAKLSCYTMCGNAFVPDFGAYVETARVYGHIEFEGTTNYSESEKSSNSVNDYFKNKYPDIDLTGDELGLIPRDEYNKIWFENFKNVKLTSIRFGYNLQK
jgi:hypothetical protein